MHSSRNLIRFWVRAGGVGPQASGMILVCGALLKHNLTARRENKHRYCTVAFALNMGIAFQIRDDILGIWGDPDKIGKSTATDILSKKKSLPVLYGLTQSALLAELYRKEHLTQSDVDSAVAELDRLQAQEYAHRIESDYYRKAMEALDLADPRGQAGDWLHQFVAALFNRSY